ncbi:MAG: AI-2E family transporter [Oscillospiraceae bacterium]|nr:AI-2E family transporter [Oscillospiraceae bacterium]
MKLHRNQKYFKWGLTAFFVIVAALVFWIVFSNLKGFYDMLLDLTHILAPILYGCLFAYLMNPVMEFTRRLMDKLLSKTRLSEKKAKKISTVVSICAAVLVLIGLLVALVALIVPNLAKSLEELLQKDRLEQYGNTITAWINRTFEGTPVEKWFHDNLDSLLEMLSDALKSIDIAAFIGSLTSSVYGVVMGVFDVLIGVIAAVYVLIYKKQLCSQAKKITVATFNAKHANRLFEIARRTNRIFSGYVVGKIVDALFVGVVTYIAMLIMGMPYAPLIATLIGVTNIIPFFGPFLGGVPATLLLLIDSPSNALIFVIFIVVLQMIDGNIIENRILGERLGISDFWVLVSILLFGGIFGFSGMLLGVPVFAVIYTVINDAVNNRLKRKRYPTETEIYYTLETVERLPVEPLPSYSYVSVDPAYDLQVEPDEEYDDYDDYDEQ